MEIKSAVSTVLSEITTFLRCLSIREIEDFTNAIIRADRVFIAGSGRVMLLSKCFAKRLSHAEVDVGIIGETTTPPVAEGNMVIVASCSGETMIPLAIAAKAREMGAKVWSITASPDSSLAKQCEQVIKLPASDYKHDNAKVLSIQPMNNLFEQGLHILFDVVSWVVQEKKGISSKTLGSHHANIE